MIDHEFFNYPINLPLIDKHELDASIIWSYFQNVVQSKKDKLITIPLFCLRFSMPLNL